VEFVGRVHFDVEEKGPSMVDVGRREKEESVPHCRRGPAGSEGCQEKWDTKVLKQALIEKDAPNPDKNGG